MQPDYLVTLNTPQRLAVEAIDGPVLVLAGAGTGKTRVLTTRIAHIIRSRKAFPGQILAVTFTNKAAREMRERVEHLLAGEEGDISAGLWLGTFHSIAAKILRRHAEAIGFQSNFTILDDDDQIRLVKQLMEELQLDPARTPAKMLHAVIQRWKDQGLTPEKVAASTNVDAHDVALRLYQLYQPRLKRLNAVDFGDLLLHNLTLFSEHKPILNQYAERFHYVLVDEYQDTNVAQYLWLRLLALKHQNLCCVGDDDQSIYGWRGAEVGNILKFEKDFPTAEIIRLEQNYRSGGHILACASGLIHHNRSRLGKTLWTEGEAGEPVKIKSVWDDSEEARFVADEVEAFQRKGIALDQIAILVRAGYQTRAFEERFVTLGIPYRVIGGLRFYERMEIRDAIAYLRLVAQPRDDLAFERIINTPKRGIGKASLEQLYHYAREHNSSLFESACSGGAVIKGKAGANLRGLCEQFMRWQACLRDMPLAELMDLILEESGYRAMWKADKSPEAPGRLDNLKELLHALEAFEDVGHFLEHVGLVTQADGAEDTQMVNVMTLHAAKGLEFDAVFLAGWEQAIFPSQRTMDEKGQQGLEEERRLAYVGITRARHHCCISHAANRRIYNQWQSSIPSRFIGELPAEHCEWIDAPLHRRSGGFELEAAADRLLASAGDASATAFEDYPQLPEPDGPQKGCRVFHQKFGYGVVLTADGGHLEIAFKHAGRKKVMAEYVQVA